MLAHTGIYISIKMKKTSCAGKVMVSEYHMHKHKGEESDPLEENGGRQ